MHKYDLDFQRELRWLSQKPIVRNIGEYPPLRRLFSSRFALVVGSQRSGTTLMFLMLTAHPRITGLDEHHAEFALPRWPVIAVNAALGKRTLYKLPMATGSVAEICRNFPKSQLIWMLRHPFAVVASMRKLTFPDGQTWIQKFGESEARAVVALFPNANIEHLEKMKDVELGATIWKYKLLMMDLYRAQGMVVHPVRYENLVETPEPYMRQLVSDLGLSWSPNVLSHHQFHGSERHAGNARGDVPLDNTRKARGKELSREQQDRVTTIAGDVMERFGY